MTRLTACSNFCDLCTNIIRPMADSVVAASVTFEAVDISLTLNLTKNKVMEPWMTFKVV